jgi:hypothetical protein
MSGNFVCRHCGIVHAGLPLAFGADEPIYVEDIPAAERSDRVSLSSDQCIIDGKHYFVRGCLEIRIADSSDVFDRGVWVSLSEKSFQRVSELWTEPGRESEPSFFGWLSSRLPGYPDTLNLKTRVHLRPVGIRPFIELEPTEHPLSLEQQRGISAERARQIAESLLHGATE